MSNNNQVNPNQPGMMNTNPNQPGMMNTNPNQPGMMNINPNQPGMMNTNPNQPGMMNNSRYVALPQNIYIWDFNNNMKFTKNENGLYHSYNDLPAIEYINNSTTRIWMSMGYVHRDNNKPAYTKMINYLGFSNKVEYREYYMMGVLQNRSIVYYDIDNKIMKEMLI